MTQAYRQTMDHSIQITNEWIKQLDEMVSWEDSNLSFRLLRITLQTIRDMLGVDEAAQFAAQLPVFIRGIYYEGWNPSRTPVRERDKADFIARVQSAFTGDQLDDPEAAVSTIFSLLNTRISAGEINDIRTSMRKSLRDIWPAPHS